MDHTTRYTRQHDWYAESTTTIASSHKPRAKIFRAYGSKEVPGNCGWLELFETSDRDWEIVGDGITPLVAKGSKDIRVRY